MRLVPLPGGVAATYRIDLHPQRTTRTAALHRSETTRWVAGLAIPAALAFTCVGTAIAFGVAWPIFLAILFGPIAIAVSIARLAFTSDTGAFDSAAAGVPAQMAHSEPGRAGRDLADLRPAETSSGTDIFWGLIAVGTVVIDIGVAILAGFLLGHFA